MKQDTPNRESFVFYRSFREAINKCPDEVQIILYRAVADYALDQVIPDFAGVGDRQFIEAIWMLIKPQLDANHQRFLNGCKGGPPIGSRNNPNGRRGKKTNQQLTENLPNVNENDNDNENDNENGLVEQTESKRDNKREKQRGNSEDDSSRDGDKWRDIRRETDASKVEDDPLILPYNDQEFIDTWNELIRQPKWRNKPKSALKLALKQLSKYGADFAVLLMENAITGNYQGVVFPDTPLRYKQWLLNYPEWMRSKAQSEKNNTHGKVITSIDEIYPD